MKLFPSSILPVLFFLLLFPLIGQAATLAGIDPCGLVAPDEMYAAFPALKKMEKQTIGPNTTCNYLDKYDIAALIVSVHKYDGISARAMMGNLGNGYKVEDVPGLGDEAAMAVTLAKPKYGIEGGGVAELYIRKGKTTLLIAPVRVKVKATGYGFQKIQDLAKKMLAGLP